MAQIITARLARIDSQPWGFRLQGGKDFGTPLVIQKVHTGSIADKAGLQAGDAVVRINQTDLFNLRHKDAQDAIVQAGPSFELVVQRGGATWKPTVTPISSAAASPIPGNFTPVTKTSLAANKQPVSAIGTGHNTAARPFVPPSPVRSIVNKQYNSPVAMYSEETIAETLTSQAEVLAGGCLGVNFKKNEKVYNPEKSEVLKALQENDSEPEPAGSTFYWRQSHAIGGSALTSQSPRPLTPNYQNIPDSRMGTSLQQNVLAPPATHRPSLPVHPVQPVQKTAPQPEQKQPETVNVVPQAFQAAAPPQISIDGVFVRIKDKNLHVECFKCATCGSSLKNQGYYNLNNKLYCDVHARLAAMNSPPPNSNGLVPVAIPPKNLGASTISSALNAHAGNLNGNHNLNESQISPTATLVSKGTKVNDDNNNNMVYDNRYISETDCSSISSSDKENDSRPSSSHGNNINKSDITDGNDTDGFRYRTINGRVIKSVIPPGKGIKVNYKVPSNISGPKPFSYTQQPIQVTHAANPPMAAPKSPSSYPPPNQPSWTPQSAAPVAPKPVGPVQGGLNKKLGFKPKEFIDIEKCNGKPREEEKTKKKKEEVYVPCDSEDEFDPQELVKIAKPPPSNFIWPPPNEEPKVPIAAPIYVPVPETLHVTAKPCTNVRPLGRPARQLTTQSLRTIETTSDCECLHVESNITATTSTTSNASSESEYKMYQTQNNHYVNMFEQHEQQQQQEQRHDDEVEEINKKQIEIDLRKTPPQIELPKDIKTIEFVEPEPGYKPETFLNVFSKKKETWQKLTQNVTTTKREEKYEEYISVQQMDDNPENSDVEEEQQVNTMEDIQQEDTEVEEINEKKEEIVEKHDEEQEGQHAGPHDGTYYQLAPSNIPQPVPKGYQSNLQKALVYSSDKPYSIRNMPPTPEPRFPCLDLYERAVREAATEPEEEKEPPKKREIPKFEVKTTKEHRDFPHNEQEVRQGNTLLSSMMRTASPRHMEFVKSNIIEEVSLPDELDAYFPPPISMVPNEPYPSLNPCRTKSPFVSALTTVSDRPFTPFGREIKSQLSFEQPQCNAPKSTFSNALHTAPDESFDPSSLEFEYIENNPIEYTAKVYERIAVEATGDEETTVSTYQHVESYPVMNQDPYQRAYIHKIQPWSTPSEQIAENTYRDSYSSSQTSTECLVSDSRRCSKAVNECDSRRTSRAANEYTVSDSRRNSKAVYESVSDSRRCSEAVNEPCCVKKNIRDLLKFDEPEEEFDPEQPCPNAPYPRRQDLPSPFEGMQVKVTNKMTSGLHKPDEIPQYQRKWFNLPTQNPPRTPEPEELRENVPVAFKEWHETKQLIASQSESVQRKEIRVTFAEKPPIPHDTNSRRGSVSEKIQWMEQTKAMTADQEEVKFPTKSGQRNENAFPTRSISIEEEINEDEERDDLGEMRFPSRSPKPTPEGAFPLKGIRKNSCADIQERQDQQFEKQKTLKQELEMQQQRMLQKNRVRQQKELQSMQKNYEKLAQSSIVEEIQQNKTLSAYEQEQEYKRQLELEKQQRQKEKELKEQQAKELEYQRQIEEKKLQEIRFQEKRERDIQIQAQREAEYQKHREEQEEALRIQQEERDLEMRRQQEEIEKEILKQQEQERRDAERREARRLFEIRRKEERDRELVRLETELREKREQELKQLEREIREKREQRQREEKEAEIQLQQERKAREDAEKEAKRLEQEAIRLQKDRERQLQTELKMRQKQEADRKQREEMELFNIEEERKRNEELSQKAKAYQSTTYQQQMVWPPSVSSTPAPNHSTNQTPMPIPIIKTDSETELNAPKFHFEPLDEEQKRFMAAIRPPSTCYSPPTEEKPYPSIPYYQQHLAFYETAPDHCGIFDPRSISPAPIQNRSRSPAFGPPPNPMRAFINKERDPVVDESGIYLCGERLLSPVWYEKGNKKIPPPVQRRIHPHASSTAHPPPKPDLEAIKESIRHKRQGTQESSTKPPPTPPPMPKTSYKATLPGVKNEAPEIKTQIIPITNNKESMIATDLLKESVDRLNINSQNSDFRKNASSVLAAMLEARMIKKQQNQGNKFEDPEFLPPPPPLPSTKPPNPNHHDQDLPLPPPPSPCKIPSSILTPPLSSDENDLPQKKSCGNNNIITEKVTYRHKKHHHSNNQSPDSSPSSSTSSFHGISKPELSTHARDRRSYIEKNNNNTNGHHYSGNEISFNNSVDKDTLDSIANGLANGQHPVCDKCKCKITRGPFVTALGRTWCPAHFLCVNQNCRRELMDIGFVEEKGDLYCEYCFEQFLAPPCSKCNGKIKGDCLNAIGRKFHPECFKCTYCAKLFGNNPFFLEEGEPYCEADWNELFTTKCFACGFPVEAGDRWVEALNNNYHSQCFNCTYCKKNLEGQSFFAKGGRPFCKNHAR